MGCREGAGVVAGWRRSFLSVASFRRGRADNLAERMRSGRERLVVGGGNRWRDGITGGNGEERWEGLERNNQPKTSDNQVRLVRRWGGGGYINVKCSREISFPE